MHPGNSKSKRLLLDPCRLTFRSITSAFVCTLPVCREKSTEKASAWRKAFIFKITGVHSSLERSVWLQLHGAIYCPDSFVLMLRYCANLKAIRYESTRLKIVANKSRV